MIKKLQHLKNTKNCCRISGACRMCVWQRVFS